MQKCQKACAVELLKQLPSAMNRRPREVFEKVSDPSNELQFETIDIELFAIDRGSMADYITFI